MKLSFHRIALASCYVAGLTSAAIYAFDGLPYYLTPLVERPRHELYWALKPGGELGTRFGMIGSTMMVLMLGYSVRKRVSWLRHLGPMNIWLDYHIFLGVLGPLFIVLHSSFKVNGLVALSFWSMIAVSLSGVLGRYLYRQIPRAQNGTELTLAEVEAWDRELTRELTEVYHLSLRQLHEIRTAAEPGLALRAQEPPASAPPLTGSRAPRDEIAGNEQRENQQRLLPWLTRLPAEYFLLRWRLFQLRRRFRNLDAKTGNRIAHLAQQKALLHRRRQLWQRLRELFHYWHVLHKPFAIIMYLFMVVHIAVAWMTGYAWSHN